MNNAMRSDKASPSSQPTPLPESTNSASSAPSPIRLILDKLIEQVKLKGQQPPAKPLFRESRELLLQRNGARYSQAISLAQTMCTRRAEQAKRRIDALSRLRVLHAKG